MNFKLFFNRYLPTVLTGLLLLAAGLIYFQFHVQTKQADAAWYNASWTYRKSITIDHNKVSGVASSTLNSFPILFSVTDSDLKTVANGGKVASSTGADILFTSADGSTKLDHEIERYASSTGETIAWVRIPILSAVTDTTIYIYFGNSSAVDQQNTPGVWNSNFKAVYHLGNGTTLSAADSTSGGFGTGTINGATATTGKVGGAGNFVAGSSQYIDIGNASTHFGTMTVEAWVKAASLPSATNIVSKGYNGVLTEWSMGSQTNKLNWGAYDGVCRGVCSSAISLSTGIWYHVVGTNDSTTWILYVNGQLDTSKADTGPFSTAISHQIGSVNSNGTPVQFWDGQIDEVRISNSVRNADWVATEYNNQTSPATFFAYGAYGIQNRSANTGAEAFGARGAAGTAWYNSAWGYRKAITIDHNKISQVSTSTFSSFPLLFSVTDSDLRTVANGGKVASSTGADILFTSSDGTTKLDHEIERYASTTGETIAWVRIPLLNASSDNIIYIYFGNSSAANQQNITGVWDANTRLTWHLGNGTTLSASDSTSNANNGTINGPTAITGQIGGGAKFVTGSSQNIQVPSGSASLDITGDLTLELWAKPTTAAAATNYIFLAKESNLSATNYELYHKALQLYWYDGAEQASGYSLTLNQWAHIAAVRSGTTLTWYVNGLPVASKTVTVVNGVSSPLYVGQDFFGQYFDGNMDEIRINATARNSDWLKTEYTNQSSPSSFYAYGPLMVNSRQDASNNTLPALKIRGGVKFH